MTSSAPSVPLRRLATCLDGQRIPISREQRASMPGDVPYWGSGGVLDTVERALFDEPLVLLGEDGAPFFEPGRDVAFLMDGPAWVNNHIHVLRPNDLVERRFLVYALNSVDYAAYITGSTRDKLTQDDMWGIRVPLPGVDSQRAIADYLDRETARIDALITAKQRMVSLLDERWAGVRATRVSQSSGDARPVQLRRIARLQAGAAFPHEAQGDPIGTIPYVKVGDLSNVDGEDRLRGAANRVTSEVAARLRSPVLPPETIVLPKIGAALLTNRRAILTEDSCLDQNVMGVTLIEGHPRYVYYCLASIDLGHLSTPGPVPLLNEEAALSTRIPWPSTREQIRVVKDLDAERAAILAPALAMERQLRLLLERRQALISAAVTGQIEVPVAA